MSDSWWVHFYYYGFFFLSFLKNQYQKSVTVNVNKVVFCVWPHMMYLFAPLANYFLCQICLNAIHWDTISLLNQWQGSHKMPEVECIVNWWPPCNSVSLYQLHSHLNWSRMRCLVKGQYNKKESNHWPSVLLTTHCLCLLYNSWTGKSIKPIVSLD